MALNLSFAARAPLWCPAGDDLVNGADDTADEIMERIVRSATQGPSQRTQPRERRRSRVNRKSRKRRRGPALACVSNVVSISFPFPVRRTLKNGLTAEEANALGLSSGSEMQV